MSRPPVPHGSRATGGGRSADGGSPRDHGPRQYAELLALAEEVAAGELGRPRPLPGTGGAQADTTRTFLELSALVAHVLAVHQRRYAGEAFIGTALAPSNMLRHARRLAYQPDVGLAGSGYVVLYAKPEVHGTVAAGLALGSVPRGDQAAQHYETLHDLAIDAALDELIPKGATTAVAVAAGDTRLRLAGVGHRLRAGDPVALVGPHWQGFVVHHVEELADGSATVVELDRGVGRPVDTTSSDPAMAPRLLAHPGRVVRPFGWAADAALYPPREIRNAAGPPTSTPVPTATPRYWYEVQRADGGGYVEDDIYLATQEAEPLEDHIVLRRAGTSAEVLRVTGEAVVGVALHRLVAQPFETQEVTVTPGDSGSYTTTTRTVLQDQTIRSHVAGTVSAVQVSNRTGRVQRRVDQPLPADWLTDWQTDVPLARAGPSAAALTEPLVLDGELAGLAPGRALAFVDRDGTAAQIVVVKRVVVGQPPGETHLWWDPSGVGAPPPGGWRLADLLVHGNVAQVSHGRTVEDVLGGSDGVTPFQRFTLAESPVTVLIGAAGAEPVLEVRVDDVRWTRVPDLAGSGPDDRHYRTETDDRGSTTVVFGDGANGAVPPSGRTNIAVRYRVGLGPEGDVEAGRLSRLKRAHPLVDRLTNVTPVAGGAAAAGIEDTRAHAPRFIRTFDRAVSVSDLADLALTLPGIARAAARWDQSSGTVLVVATATGATPPDLDAVRAFLDARRDVTVPLHLLGPSPTDVELVVEIEADPAHLVELVRASVRAALHGGTADRPGLFTFPARGLGQPAYLSEVYARLDAEPGVVGVRVLGFGSRADHGVADVVPAGIEQWLRLRPTDLGLTVVGGAP